MMTFPAASGACCPITMNLTLTITVPPGEPATACELVAAASALPKSRIKDAMGKGAVWLRHGSKRRRLRRATAVPAPGEVLELFYDEELLQRSPPLPRRLADEKHYTLWYKPPGLLAQGNDYGDHCSLLRQAELQLRRPVFLVHRLDREAAGLMLVAHSRDAAARLSRLFQEHGIDKRYQVRVRGRLPAPAGTIDLPLDGKPARTGYTVTLYDPATDTTQAAVTLASGRLHQIRRHLALLGHPVIGDPRYGTGNKNNAGLQLVAVGLAFRCPFSGAHRSYEIPDELPADADQAGK